MSDEDFLALAVANVITTIIALLVGDAFSALILGGFGSLLAFGRVAVSK